MGERKISLPQDLILSKLLAAARQFPESETVVHDAYGFEKSYPELLGDILQMRDTIREGLPVSAIDGQGILYETSKYIATLTRTSYEVLVAFFAIQSMGGVWVPLGSGVFPEEAEYILAKVKSTCLLVGRESTERAEDISSYIYKNGGSVTLTMLPIVCGSEPLSPMDIAINDTLHLDPAEPSMVMFTSGTTGRPKGVVLSRRLFADSEIAGPGRVAITHRPKNWLSGACELIDPVLRGKKLYAIKESMGGIRADAVLATFRDHRITDAEFTPALLRRMKNKLTDQIRAASNEEEERERLSSRYKDLTAITSTSGVAEPSTIDFWKSFTGLPFGNIYGSTELGGIAIGGYPVAKGSICTPLPGMEVKLSEGDSGEIYVKSPRMFLRYFGDEKATQGAFNEEGYYKTGDLGIFKDGEYIFAGRANTDYVQFCTYRFSTVDVESRLLDLPYISDACAVAVPSHNYKQLCAAIVQFQPDIKSTSQPDLAKIRSDLSSSLGVHMLPNLLRVLKDDEKLPRTISEKPIRRQILQEYFGVVNGAPPENLPLEVQRCEKPFVPSREPKAWERAGLQFAR
ncbi:hypothetical protein FQN49_003234 [Arthroderma sp. PD_2]|nr:hypothetical protein FQN49_003234 [Arthroderma sp. PD_2]